MFKRWLAIAAINKREIISWFDDLNQVYFNHDLNRMIQIKLLYMFLMNVKKLVSSICQYE